MVIFSSGSKIQVFGGMIFTTTISPFFLIYIFLIELDGGSCGHMDEHDG